MKVLVIDDKVQHQESARTILAQDGHEAIVVGSYDEAIDILVPGNGFDAVLSDMMMPMSPRDLGRGIYDSNKQMPYGFVLALRAAAAGAKYVAVVTDTNHHADPISAALDRIGGFEGDKEAWNCAWEDGALEPRFEINSAKAFFIHAPLVNGAKDWGRVLAALTGNPKPAEVISTTY